MDKPVPQPDAEDARERDVRADDSRLPHGGPAVPAEDPVIPPFSDDFESGVHELDQELGVLLVEVNMRPPAESSEIARAIESRAAALRAGRNPSRTQAMVFDGLAARIAITRSDLAAMAGDLHTAQRIADSAYRMAVASRDRVMIGSARRKQAAIAMEAGRPAEALQLLADGLRRCPEGPVAAALLARQVQAHALAGAHPDVIEQQTDSALAAASALPVAEQGMPGLFFTSYHPADAKERALTANALVGRVRRAENLYRWCVPVFDAIDMPGWSSGARFTLATSLVLSGGRLDLERSAELVEEAVTISLHRRTGALSVKADRWIGAVRPHAAGTRTIETISRVRAWQRGELNA
ncbi:hypothetical protein FsymDg_2161 [Candidatus Protofrankia datiscae]|uniref:Uncharacterized protein n=1 Tax=Candidatus Protofrankia datiscae TaxID=2716812 RepID=F8AYY3_9ACTN|nr:hypothetical protein FsymDg_2161 [Candidatus Protofrankia datiscae]